MIYTVNGTMREDARFQVRMIRLQTLMREINETYPIDYEIGMGEEEYIWYTLHAMI